MTVLFVVLRRYILPLLLFPTLLSVKEQEFPSGCDFSFELQILRRYHLESNGTIFQWTIIYYTYLKLSFQLFVI